MTSPARLRIAVLGAGKIGSAFAFHLSLRGGHDVTVVARPGSVRLSQLERDQAIVDEAGTKAPVRVADALDEETPYDLVIVTCLAHQAAPLLPTLKRSAAGCVQFMFNTFEPQMLEAAVGVERCGLGMQFIQATLDADGRLDAKVGTTGRVIMDRQRWVDVFTAAGLPAALEPDMRLWLRCHTPVCMAFESVAVAGMRRGGGASWREALVLAGGVHVSFQFIEALGCAVYPRSKKRIARSPAVVIAAALWAMSRIPSFRELLATGETECHALIDQMTAAARLARPPVATAAILAMKPRR